MYVCLFVCLFVCLARGGTDTRHRARFGANSGFKLEGFPGEDRRISRSESKTIKSIKSDVICHLESRGTVLDWPVNGKATLVRELLPVWLNARVLLTRRAKLSPAAMNRNKASYTRLDLLAELGAGRTGNAQPRNC